MAVVCTLTLNPCLDRTLDAATGAVLDEQTGGKGVNAARVLTALGEDCLAVAPVGAGERGARFRLLAAREGISLRGVPVAADTRRIDTWRDGDAQRQEYVPGSDASAVETDSLRHALRESLAGARLLMVCGSAPGPRLASLAGEAIRMARELGVATLLDSHGPALTEGLAAGPDFLTPNEAELAELLGRGIAPGEEAAAAEELFARHAAEGLCGVVVTLGARGAVWAREGGTLFCPAPKVRTVNAVGSGDCFAASLVWSLLHGCSDQGALAIACAAGAANAAVFPAARVGRKEIEAMLGWSLPS